METGKWKEFRASLKEGLEFTWKNKTWWYLGLLSAFIVPLETVTLSLPFRIASQPLDAIELKFFFNNLFSIFNTVIFPDAYTRIGFAVIIFLFLAFSLFCSFYLKSLMLNVLNGKKIKVFSGTSASLKIFGTNLIFRMMALGALAVFVYLLSFYPHPLLQVLTFLAAFAAFAFILVWGFFSTFAAVLNKKSVRDSIGLSFSYIVKNFLNVFLFFLCMIFVAIIFAVLLTLAASLVLLPLIAVGAIFYSIKMVYPFWGVVITSLITISILVIFAVSLFNILKVRLWSEYFLKHNS